VKQRREEIQRGCDVVEKRIIKVITEQTKILFQNIHQVLDAVSDDQMDKTIFDAPLWKHIYHMLHSLDQYFINPYVYDNPDFHEYGMNSFAVLTNNRLSKNTLVKYFKNIEEKVFCFFDNLDDSSLIKTPESCGFTRLTLILAQYRHVMYHVGFITSILHYTEEKWPKYIGISAPIIQ